MVIGRVSALRIPIKVGARDSKDIKEEGSRTRAKAKARRTSSLLPPKNQWYGDWPQEQWPGEQNGAWTQQPGGPVPLSAVVKKYVRRDDVEEVSTNNRYDALSDDATPYNEEFPALHIDDAPA